ncbi:MAG: hypothetical protein GY829_12015, partial [Gammaproteobacteria bacterium]|nr:hypothetical protein [Gammaproteobacteria bacterium]
MGFFSWITSDTNESIINIHSVDNKARPVYLIQPKGRAAIEEREYDGYGIFGDTDAFVWLAENNFNSDELKHMTTEQIRYLGIDIDWGGFYQDKTTDNMYCFSPEICELFDNVTLLKGNYDTIVDGYHNTANELIDNYQWIRQPIVELLHDDLIP